MNIQLAEKLLTKTQEAENALLDIEIEIGKLAPDLYSNLESKKNILTILKLLSTLKDDLIRFREGKALVNLPKIMLEKLDNMNSGNSGSGVLGEFKDMFNNEDGPFSNG